MVCINDHCLFLISVWRTVKAATSTKAGQSLWRWTAAYPCAHPWRASSRSLLPFLLSKSSTKNAWSSSRAAHEPLIFHCEPCLIDLTSRLRLWNISTFLYLDQVVHCISTLDRGCVLMDYNFKHAKMQRREAFLLLFCAECSWCAYRKN